MKYIRTKTYIYEKPDDKYIENNQVLHFANRPTEEEKIGFSCYAEYEDILKEADTIEELCDLYVTHYKIGEKDSYDIRVSLEAAKWFAEKDHPNFDSFKVCAIYGAIWTDKGLIYVAKMNEKGELELL